MFTVAETASAFDATTGEQLRETSGTAARTLTVTDSHLFVVIDRYLVALMRTDGSDHWSIGLSRPAGRPVTVAPGASLVTVPVVARQGAPGIVAFGLGYR